MGILDQIRLTSRVLAEAAMQQPGVRRRVESAWAFAEGLRDELRGRLMDLEEQAWRRIRELEQEARRIERHRQRTKDASYYYGVLGLSSGASLKEVKAAYRKKMRENHPDRFAQDAEAEARAHERAQEINEAYAQLTALLTGRESRAAG